MNLLYICIAIAAIVVGAIIASLLANWYTKRPRNIRYASEHQFDRMTASEITFNDRLKAAGMKSETVLTCGQNIFAYDREKGKLLVQTQQVPEGVLLHSRDVLSYTLLRDGQAAAERFREGGEGITAAANLSSDCERIELRVETKHKDYPHMTMVLMPFRFERAETRESAMDAAMRIAAALEEILSERV